MAADDFPSPGNTRADESLDAKTVTPDIGPEKLNGQGVAGGQTPLTFGSFVDDQAQSSNDLFDMQLGDVDKLILTPPKMKIPEFAAGLYRSNQFNYERLMTTAHDGGRASDLADGSTSTTNRTANTAQSMIRRQPSSYLLQQSATTAALGTYQFHRTVSANYMRKMLALTYHQNTTLNSISTITGEMGKMIESKLDAIKLNTSVPDARKASFLGMLKGEFRTQWMRSFVDTTRKNTSAYIKPRLNQYVLGPAAQKVSDYLADRQSVSDIGAAARDQVASLLRRGAARVTPESGDDGSMAPGVLNTVAQRASSILNRAAGSVAGYTPGENTQRRFEAAGRFLKGIAPTGSISDFINRFLDDAGSQTSAPTDSLGVPIYNPIDASNTARSGPAGSSDFQTSTLGYLEEIVKLLRMAADCQCGTGEGRARPEDLRPYAADPSVHGQARARFQADANTMRAAGPETAPGAEVPSEGRAGEMYGPWPAEAAAEQPQRSFKERLRDKVNSATRSVMSNFVNPHDWNHRMMAMAYSVPTSREEVQEILDRQAARLDPTQHVDRHVWNNQIAPALMSIPTSADDLRAAVSNARERVTEAVSQRAEQIDPSRFIDRETWNNHVAPALMNIPTSAEEARERVQTTRENLTERIREQAQRFTGRPQSEPPKAPTGRDYHATEMSDMAERIRELESQNSRTAHTGASESAPASEARPSGSSPHPADLPPPSKIRSPLQSLYDRTLKILQTTVGNETGLDNKLLSTLSSIREELAPHEHTERVNSYSSILQRLQQRAKAHDADARNGHTQDAPKGKSIFSRLADLLHHRGDEDGDDDHRHRSLLDRVLDIVGDKDRKPSRRKRRGKRGYFRRLFGHDGPSSGRGPAGRVLRGAGRLTGLAGRGVGGALSTVGRVGSSVIGVGTRGAQTLARSGTTALLGDTIVSRALGGTLAGGIGLIGRGAALGTRLGFGAAGLGASMLGRVGGGLLTHVPGLIGRGAGLALRGGRALLSPMALGGMAVNYLTDKVTTAGSGMNRLGHTAGTAAEYAAMGSVLGPAGAIAGAGVGALVANMDYIKGLFHLQAGNDAKLDKNGKVVPSRKKEGVWATIKSALLPDAKADTLGTMEKLRDQQNAAAAAGVSNTGYAAPPPTSTSPSGLNNPPPSSDVASAGGGSDSAAAQAAINTQKITDQKAYKDVVANLPKNMADRVGKSDALQFTVWAMAQQLGTKKAVSILMQNYSDGESDNEFMRKVFQSRQGQFMNSTPEQRAAGIVQVSQQQDYANGLADGSTKGSFSEAAKLTGFQVQASGDGTVGGINYPTAPASGDLKKREKDAVAYLQKKGWTEAQAIGIVANLRQESSLNPNVRPGDGGTAQGMAQWHPDRQAAIQRHFKVASVSQLGFYGQLDAVDWEIRSGADGGGTLKNLSAAKTPAEAARAVSKYYERPGNTPQARLMEQANRAGLAMDISKTMGAGSTAVASTAGASQNIASATSGGSAAPTAGAAPSQATTTASTSKAQSAQVASASAPQPSAAAPETEASTTPAASPAPASSHEALASAIGVSNEHLGNIVSVLQKQHSTLNGIHTAVKNPPTQVASSAPAPSGPPVVIQNTNTTVHSNSANQLSTARSGSRSGVV